MMRFVFLALLLSLAAGAFLVLPLLRPRAQVARAPLAAAVSALALLAAGLGLYAMFGQAYWSAPPAQLQNDRTLAPLALHVERHPEDEQGWLSLAQGYAGLGNYALAQRCYESANRLSGGHDPAALSGMAEAMLMQEDSGRSEQAAALFERALSLDPHNAKALFYSAVIAYRQGRLELARTRFTTILSLDPPESVRTALQRQIDEIDARLRAPGQAGGQQGAVPAAAGDGRRVDAATAIRLHVTLSPALSRQVPAAGALFVFVRSPDGGPPLAVKRAGLRLPQDLELSAADAMVPDHAVRPGQSVAVVARISASGSAVPASGDLYGEIRAVAGSRAPLALQIDRRTP